MELNLGQSVLPEVRYFTLAAVCLRASYTTSDFLGRAGKRGSKGRAPSERRREHHGGKCFGNGKAPPKPQLWLLLQEWHRGTGSALLELSKEQKRLHL